VQEFQAGNDVSSEQRKNMMRRFKENKARILISTDAAAKGIDVPNVTMVVQMELVMSGKEEGGFNWITTQNKALAQFRHRSGRTARALQRGINIVLCKDGRETQKALEYMRIIDVKPANLKHIQVDASGTIQDEVQLREFVEAAQH
jgi:superfamily II DNA/RNA helicase